MSPDGECGPLSGSIRNHHGNLAQPIMSYNSETGMLLRTLLKLNTLARLIHPLQPPRAMPTRWTLAMRCCSSTAAAPIWQNPMVRGELAGSSLFAVLQAPVINREA